MQASKINPNDAQAARSLASNSVKEGNYAEAEKYYRQAVSINASDRDSKFQLAFMLLKQKKQEDARRILQELSLGSDDIAGDAKKLLEKISH